MVTPKTESFDLELQRKASFFKALSHPARIQILEFLITTRKCLTGDISDRFPLTRTTINQHMNELKKAGLICGHKEGTKMVYCINVERMVEMEEVLAGFINDIKIPEDFCCSL